MVFFLFLLIQFFTFGILAVILRNLLSRHVTGASGHLQVLTEESTRKLEDAKKRMEEAQQHYQATVMKAREEAEKIKQDAFKEAQATKDEMVRQARQQSEVITSQAQNAGEALVKEIQGQIENAALTQAHQIVQQLLQGGLSEETHRHWVEELVKNGFNGLSRMNVAEDLKSVTVVSAFPLGPDQKSLIHKRIKEKLKYEIPLHETVDPALVAGVKITLGGIVIDGTLKFKIQEMVRHVHRTSDK